MFTLLFTFLFIYLFTWKVAGSLNLKFGYEVEFELNLEVLKKCLGSPCYLVVVSGGSFFLVGQN